MNPKSVFCISTSRIEAERIVDSLRASQFTSDDISVLFPDKQTTHEFVHEKHTKAPEGAAAGVSAGGLAGGALGWMAGLGALAIPGIGPLAAAGPIVAALSGLGVGAALGGITGALIGLGIPEFEAKRYEGKIKDGNILLAVHVEDAEEEATARKIFRREGGDYISSTSEATVPRSMRPDAEHDYALRDN